MNPSIHTHTHNHTQFPTDRFCQLIALAEQAALECPHIKIKLERIKHLLQENGMFQFQKITF